MSELKPYPFCGGKSFSYRFIKDNRMILGVRHEICTIECLGCTASVRQAGPTREKAEENAADIWNMRVET